MTTGRDLQGLRHQLPVSLVVHGTDLPQPGQAKSQRQGRGDRRAGTPLQQQGTPVVAAVGNGGPAAPVLYPAGYPGVIGVTAVDRESKVYR